jgi:two-component system, NtrC family, response regulator AtoC
VLAHGSEIDLEHLPADIAGTVKKESNPEDTFRPLGIMVKEFEKQYIVRALRLSGGSKSQAADLLGISRKNLWEKLKLHGISDVAESEGRSH